MARLERVVRAALQASATAGRRAWLAAAALGLAWHVASADPAYACGRSVYINGMLTDCHQLAALDQAVGERIPDAAYWLDHQSGAWGYWGIPVVQGYVDMRVLGGGAPRSSGGSTSPDEYVEQFGDSGSMGAYVDGKGRRCQFVSAGELSYSSCE